MVKLDIWSDPICPWSLIGKTLLDRALAARPDHPFQITWHPFQLNPGMPAGGVPRAQYLETKFGGRDKAVAAYAPILDKAAEIGLEIDFGAIPRTPNTMDAHRLIHWARTEDRQQQAVDALFDAFFFKHLDIGAPDVLTQIAGDIGLDRAVIARLLQGEADKDLVMASDIEARRRGITGVPTYIVADTHVVTGAQPTGLWLQVIEELTGAPPGAALQ